MLPLFAAPGTAVFFSARSASRLRALVTVTLLLALSGSAMAAGRKLTVPILPLSEVTAGMRGEAYTVFEGVTPEKMEVEVLGVLRNMAGPKGDVILVRLHGAKAEYTGVVAGMSGSPVYIDGKLVGALAYRIGDFSKEPIGGVTPIESMLEISEIDTTPGPADASNGAQARGNATATSGPGNASTLPLQALATYLKPIDTPLVFSGFTEDAIRRFSAQFAQAGIVPVVGAGSSSDARQPEPIVPGSSVGAVLVRGDVDISATCTVTYIDPTHLLACGHPFLGAGPVDLAMTKSRVMATLASPLNSFKIASTTETVGSFVQDRRNGILGRFGKDAQMIPVTLNITGGTVPRSYHFEVLNNARLTPQAMMVSVYNAIQGNNNYGEDTTFRVKGSIAVAGYPGVNLNNMFAPADGGNPTAVLIALSVGERFTRIYENPYERPKVERVELIVEAIRERRVAQLETARTDVTEVRPGDEIKVETVLHPYRGDRIVRQLQVKIPASTPRGVLRILVSDADTLDRIRRISLLTRKFELANTIAMLNNEHSNSRLYISLLGQNPQAMVEDKVMPALPLSVMNVMDGMRGTQEMLVLAESSVNEASTQLDYVVTGAQIITVTVR